LPEGVSPKTTMTSGLVAQGDVLPNNGIQRTAPSAAAELQREVASGHPMCAGQAHGSNREYQLACRNVLMFRDPALVPWQADRIDIPFKLPDTEWTFDVALRGPSEGLLVAEGRRTASAVKQEEVAAFAYKVELLPHHAPEERSGLLPAPRSRLEGGNRAQEADDY